MPPRSASQATVRVRATEPRDVLAAVPYMLGYHPRNSLIMLGIRDGRLGPVARIDIADARREPADAGRHIARLLGLAGVPECIVVVMDDAEPTWLDTLTDRLEDSGVLASGGWQVGGEHYWPLADPSDRRPLDELAASSVAAEFVLAGYNPVHTREALSAGLTPYPDALRARLAAKVAVLDAREAEMEAVCAWCGLLGDRTVSRPRPSRSASLPRPLTDKATANLLAAIACADVRDALLAAAILPGQPYELCLRALAGEDDEDWERVPPTGPDRGRTTAATVVLTHLARASSGVAAAQPLAMLAHVYWWMGEGTMANVAVDLAMQADPSHRLAGLLAQALQVGMPPPWRLEPPSFTSWPEGA